MAAKQMDSNGPLPIQMILGFIQRYLGVGLALAAAFLIGVLWTQVRYLKSGYTGEAQTSPTAQAPAAQQAAPEPQTILTDDQWNKLLENPAAELGKKDAPITMVEFTDFQCPFCEQYYSQSYKTLVKDYVDTGKMRIVFRDLPLSFHANAHIAAQAARCAAEQGKYIEMHDALFDNQVEWVGDNVTDLQKKTENAVASFKKYAGEIGLNVGSFSSCYDNGSTKAAVDTDITLAGQVGAGGTPTFYINKEQIVGAQPVTSFQAMIDAALAGN